MSDSELFARRLAETAAQLTWAALLVPEARRHTPVGENWSPARIIYHMLHYERDVALPAMRQWLGGSPVADEAFEAEDAHWEAEGQAMSFAALLDGFNGVRAEQVALAPRLAGLWDEARPTGWDMPGVEPTTLRWVVSKTIQHTFEHSNELMRNSLFLDRMQAHRAMEQAGQSAGE
jgi:hypothetical protein